MANLTATDRASLVQTPVKKKTPTGKQRGRPKATEVVAKTNRKMDEFYRKKPVQGDVEMPPSQVEEGKRQGEPSEAQIPQPKPIQEERIVTGTLRVQVIEESKAEVFMTAKVDNPEARRIQMIEQMRKSKRK